MTAVTAGAGQQADPPSRRERLRQELTREIKEVALSQLAEGGPSAVTLRGIAREIGVSPAALYGYFASLDDLFTALITDGFNDLADAVEAVIANRADAPPQDRLLAGLYAYRQWALDHAPWFRLLYYSPVPGYVAPEDGPTVDASMRVSVAFLAVLSDAWASGVRPRSSGDLQIDCTKFHERFGLEITPEQLRSAVGDWGKFHGMVSLEVNGHISDNWVDPEALYEATMRTMQLEAGMPPASPEITPAAIREELRARG